MFGKLGRLFGRAWKFVIQQRESGAFLMLALGSLILFAAANLWEDLEAGITSSTGLSRFAFYLILLGAALLCLLAILALNWRRIGGNNRSQGIRIPPRDERLRSVIIDTLPQLKQIQGKLVPAIFGTATPPSDEIYRSFARNPRRSIALYSDSLAEFVGFASFWPITERAAAALKAGEIVEEELKAADILPADENQSARYAVIPAIAVLGHEESWGKRRGLKLLHHFAEFIEEEFLAQPGRSIELIATGWSDEGRELCGFIEMDLIGRFPHDGEMLPLFVKQIDIRTIKRGKADLVG